MGDADFTVSGRFTIQNDAGQELNALTNQVNNVQKSFQQAGPAIQSSFGNALKGLESQTKSTGNVLTNTFSKLFPNLSSKISSSLSGAKSAIASFSTSVQSSLQGIVTMGNQVYKQIRFIGTAMVAIFTYKLKNAIQDATSVFMTFDDQMRKVAAVTESTGATFDALTAKAREMGATTSFTAQDAAEAMTLLGQAGFDANEIMASIPATLDLARASMTDLTTTADIMSNIMNGFQIEADDTARVSDVLAKAANATNTDVTQLGNAMKYVAPLAYQVGWSLEETASAAGLLSNAGIKSSMAGTVLRNAISRLLSPTQKASGILASYGITLDSISPKTHNFAQIIDILSQSGMTAGDVMQVFGMRAGPGILAMMNIGTGAIRNMNQTLLQSQGYAKEAADMMDAGWGGAVRRFNDAVESLKLTFGKAFATIFTPFIKAISVLGVAISKLPSPIIYFASAMALAAVGAGTLLTSLAALRFIAPILGAGMEVLTIGSVKIAMGLAKLSAMGGTVGTIFTGIASAVATLVPQFGLIVAGVTAVVAVFYVLEQKTQLVSNSIQFLKDVWTIGTFYLGKAFDGLKEKVTDAVDGIVRSLYDLAKNTWIGKFVDTVIGAYDRLATYLGKVKDSTHESAEAIRAEEARQIESSKNVQGQIKSAHDGTIKSYQMVDEATGQTYASMIENASEYADNVVGANGEIISSNDALIASNNGVAASFAFKMEDTDISSVVSQNYGIDDFNSGIELADGGFIKLNEHGQLIYQTVDGISKILSEMPSMSLKTAEGGTIQTNTDVPRSSGSGRKIKVGAEGQDQNAKDEEYINSPEYTKAQWAKTHPDYTSVDLTKYPGFTAEQIKRIESGEWDKPIDLPDKTRPTKGLSGFEKNAIIARENKLTPEQTGTIPKGIGNSGLPKDSEDYKEYERRINQKSIMQRLNESYEKLKKPSFLTALMSGDNFNDRIPGTENVQSASFDFTNIFKNIELLKEKVGSLDSISLDGIKTTFGNLKENIANSITDIPIVKSTMETLNGVSYESLKTSVKGYADSFVDSISNIPSVKATLETLNSISYEGLKTSVSGYVDSFTNSISNIPSVKSTLETLNSISYDGLKTSVSGYVDSFTNSISNIPSVKATLETLNSISYDSLKTSVQGYMDSFTNSVTNIPSVKSTLETLNSISYDGLKTSIQGYVDSFTTSVSSIPFIKFIMETLNSVSYEGLKTSIMGYASKFLDSIKNIPLVKTTISSINNISFESLLSKIGSVSSAFEGLITAAKDMYSKVAKYVDDAKSLMSSKSSGGSGSSSNLAKATQMTDSEKATRAANNAVYNNNVKINTVNNNGTSTSKLKLKKAGV